MAKREQLRIGPPGKESPGRVFLEVFGLTFLTCAVLFAIAMPRFLESTEVAPKLAPDAPELVNEAAAKLRQMNLEEVQSSILRWDLATQKAALEFGPRHASEALCERIFTSPESVDVQDFRELMADALAERAEHAPRNCLLVQWFSKRFEQEQKDRLATEVARYWAEMQSFETLSAQNAFLVNSLRQDGRLPVQQPSFVRWLRRCAVRVQDIAWLSCVEAMKGLAPHQGRDLLEMAELHLMDRADPELPLPEEHVLELTELLTMLGAQGSPDVWRIEENGPLLNYDYDLRLASIFMLCRFTMSNDRVVAEAAAQGVGKIASKQVTMNDRGLWRIRDTCRIAFGGKTHDLEVVSVPVVAEHNVPELKVLDSSMDEQPQYTFADLIQRGECVFERGYPLWHCGAKLWKGASGKPSDDLERAWINTRFVEWVDRSEIPDVDSDLLRTQSHTTASALKESPQEPYNSPE